MIKILKTGTKEEIECNNCGCLFTYEAEDVLHHYSNINLRSYHYDYIQCPQCHKEIKVGAVPK